MVTKIPALTISKENQYHPSFFTLTSIAVAIDSFDGFSPFIASPFVSTSGKLIRRIPSTFDDHKGHTLGGFRTSKFSQDAFSFHSYCGCIDQASTHLQMT